MFHETCSYSNCWWQSNVNGDACIIILLLYHCHCCWPHSRRRDLMLVFYTFDLFVIPSSYYSINIMFVHCNVQHGIITSGMLKKGKRAILFQIDSLFLLQVWKILANVFFTCSNFESVGLKRGKWFMEVLLWCTGKPTLIQGIIDI